MKINQSEISNLLIVGDSDSSVDLSQNLIDVAEFARIIHVSNPNHAVNLLLEEPFQIVIIDDDDPKMDSTKFCKVIKTYQKLAKIITISKSYSPEYLKSLINSGAIYSFLPVPIDSMTAYQTILEAEAKYQIDKMLHDMVMNPLKYTPAYYRQQDFENNLIEDKESKILGCIISYHSLSRISFFQENIISLDEYLAAGYLTAITYLGEQLFRDEDLVKELNFGGVSVLLSFVSGLQFSFFIYNLNKGNYTNYIKLIDDIISEISGDRLEYLCSEKLIPVEVHNNLVEILKSSISNYNYKENHKNENEVTIGVFGLQFLTLSVELESLSKDYKILQFKRKKELYNYITEKELNILVLNQSNANIDWIYPLVTHVKEISPQTQIICVYKIFSSNYLNEILKIGLIDYVLCHKDIHDELGKWVKEAADKSKIILKYINGENLVKNDDAEISISVLKKLKENYTKRSIPYLYGLFIIRDGFPFYKNFWPKSGTILNFDDQLFAGYITSLNSFSEEMFSPKDTFSGLKYGEANLITKVIFNFNFVFFITNLQKENLNFTKKIIDEGVSILYDEIVRLESEYDEFENKNIVENINQLSRDIFMKFYEIE